jgi:hypothetical protein
MSLDYATTCPHCGENHSIPYQDVRHHIYHILGQESARKRKDFNEHMHKMQRSNREKLHPRQQAILELAKHVDLDSLKLREIAEKVGITGKYSASQIWSHMNKLRKKGLLSYKRRTPAFPTQQI